MRFRPPLKSKWFYPFVLCGMILLAYGLIRLKAPADLPPRMLAAPFYFIVFLGLGSCICISVSWTVWTSRVDVDDIGIRWKRGKDVVSMRWEQIESLALHGINLSLIERGSGKQVDLPFSSRKLYDALTVRLKPLSPDEEAILFPKR